MSDFRNTCHINEQLSWCWIIITIVVSTVFIYLVLYTLLDLLLWCSRISDLSLSGLQIGKTDGLCMYDEKDKNFVGKVYPYPYYI